MSNPNLQKIIKLTQAQYDTLSSGGTVGDYTGLNDNYLYLIQDSAEYLPIYKGNISSLTLADLAADGITSCVIFYSSKAYLCSLQVVTLPRLPTSYTFKAQSNTEYGEITTGLAQMLITEILDQDYGIWCEYATTEDISGLNLENGEGDYSLQQKADTETAHVLGGSAIGDNSVALGIGDTYEVSIDLGASNSLNVSSSVTMNPN